MWLGTKRLMVGCFVLASALCLYLLCCDDRPSRLGPSTTPSKHKSRANETIGILDVCLTIKTSKQFHETRLDVILKTWFRTALGQVHIITDGEDAKYQRKTGNRMVDSKCGTTHGLYDLCCKSGIAFDIFMAEKHKRWWCSFDDDNYVHVERLFEYLSQFDSASEIYIGRRSTYFAKFRYKGKTYRYQFGHGGSGICMTRPLAERLESWCGKTQFSRTCGKLDAAEDCAFGFLITKGLRVNLTESELLHSHYEELDQLKAEHLHQQISFSYNKQNVLDLSTINPKFDDSVDPTRFMSLHCHLYPNDDLCK